MHTSARQTLGEYQKAMLDLLKERAGASFSDPHLAEVVHSPGLGLLREVAVWWRGFAVESACPWTARLRKKLQRFESSVETFYRSQNVSPYVEKAGEEFLFRMSADPEPLVAAMARLELALLRMRQGSSDEYLIEWDRNPDPVEIHRTCTYLDAHDPAMLEWIADSQISALVSDNYAVEGMVGGKRNEDRHSLLPIHHLCLFKLGVPLGEMWYLHELATWLREHNRSRFLLTAPPLRLPGAVGSPLTPIATV